MLLISAVASMMNATIDVASPTPVEIARIGTDPVIESEGPLAKKLVKAECPRTSANTVVDSPDNPKPAQIIDFV